MKQFLLICFLIVLNKAADSNSVTLSGLSSGAYFSTQYQFAHSASIQGVAIFAGGPYYCAQNNLNTALLACMNNLNTVSLPVLESYARTSASIGAIDPLTNLAKHKVYIFSGTQDATVKPSVVKLLDTMYRNLGVQDISTNFNLVAAHTFPTLSYGNPCTAAYTPYISKCNYDGAGEALKTLYGDLKPPVAPIPSNFVTLEQSQFTGGRSPAALSLGPRAYLYVPSGCKTSGANCRLHVAFHGCQQYMNMIQLQYVENTGYNGWAEANDILVLYPQAIVMSSVNPNGCWDWWGYLSANYARKTGEQIQFTKTIIDYVLENY